MSLEVKHLLALSLKLTAIYANLAKKEKLTRKGCWFFLPHAGEESWGFAGVLEKASGLLELCNMARQCSSLLLS